MSTNSLVPEQPSAPNWISQSAAARIRGVSRQAINNLVQRGKLSTIDVGGYALVNRTEVEQFVPAPAGRQKKKSA